MLLTYDGYEAANRWRQDLQNGVWPRGRVVASKQAAVLDRLIGEYDAYERWCAEQNAIAEGLI